MQTSVESWPKYICDQLTILFVPAMPVNTAHVDDAKATSDQEDDDVPVIILLHGVGESGGDWTNFLRKIAPPNTRLILPTAPKAPVNMFGFIEMNSW